MTYLEHRLQLKLNGKPKEETKRYEIAKRSKKRIKDQKTYVGIVKEMMEESNKCQMEFPGCTVIADGLHHQKKRAGNFLDKQYLIRACNHCNLFAELHPLQAIEKGLSISKFSKD